VSFKPLTEGVYLYEVRTDDKHQVIPANGLVLATQEGPVLVDTGWRGDQTEALIAFTERIYGRLPAVAIITHAHADRSGGLKTVRARGIRVAWLDRTAALVNDRRDGDLVFSDAAQVGAIELWFPGRGHAPDNIVVWHSPSKTLYGGCFIKAAEQGIGWTGDADFAQWPSSLAAVAARYPDAKTVVPGHGNPGGPELLAHTAAVISAQ
jgi:metallo-beta-lactamase class B